jgi:hypothetical protein
MTVTLLLVFLLSGGSLNALIFKSLLLQITEFGVLAAMSCVFSALSTTTLAAIIASGIWVIGHAMSDLRLLAQKIEPFFLRPILDIVSRVLPDLTRFDIKAEVAHQLPVTWGYATACMGYGFVYILFALVVACVAFSKRDL